MSIKSLPPQSVRVIALLILINVTLWVLIPILVFPRHPRLAAPAALSYALGLRHALDADHIAAIDLTTRRLIASGRRPATVGTFFSLGHSTVVVATCVAVAATSGALRERFDGFAHVGNIVGSAVSATFLVVLCIGNGIVLHGLVRKLRTALERRRQLGYAGADDETYEDTAAAVDLADAEAAGTGGLLTRVFGRLFKAIDRPWKMYPLGFIFGLGFDTSSEIAILGIASIQAVQGTSIWLILIFPILFTSGMCLLDTTDGALMLALYTSKAFARDPIAILYYSTILTAITVGASAFIGLVQVLTLVQNVAEPEGPFWDLVDAIGESFDIIGACICGLFLLVGVGSIFVYKPWRQRMDRIDHGRRTATVDNGEDHQASAASPLLGQDRTREATA